MERPAVVPQNAPIDGGITNFKHKGRLSVSVDLVYRLASAAYCNALKKSWRQLKNL